MSKSTQERIVEENQRHSEGLIFIVYDEDGDPIQAWDEDEEVVKEHVLKYGWSYRLLPAFRKEK